MFVSLHDLSQHLICSVRYEIGVIFIQPGRVVALWHANELLADDELYFCSALRSLIKHPVGLRKIILPGLWLELVPVCSQTKVFELQLIKNGGVGGSPIHTISFCLVLREADTYPLRLLPVSQYEEAHEEY